MAFNSTNFGEKKLFDLQDKTFIRGVNAVVTAVFFILGVKLMGGGSAWTGIAYLIGSASGLNSLLHEYNVYNSKVKRGIAIVCWILLVIVGFKMLA